MFFKVHDPYFSFFKLWYFADVDLWDNHQDLHERNLGFSCVCGAVCMVLQPCSLSCFPQFHTRLGYPFYSFDFQNFQKNSNVIVEHRKPRTHSPPQVDDPLIVWLSPSGLYWLYCQSMSDSPRGHLRFGYNVMLEIRVLIPEVYKTSGMHKEHNVIGTTVNSYSRSKGSYTQTWKSMISLMKILLVVSKIHVSKVRKLKKYKVWTMRFLKH